MNEDREVLRSGTYQWSFVTQIFPNGYPSGERKTSEVMIGLFSINDERVRSTVGLNPGCIKPKIFRAKLSCWWKKNYVAIP
jgi:hypothetical protein